MFAPNCCFPNFLIALVAVFMYGILLVPCCLFWLLRFCALLVRASSILCSPCLSCPIDSAVPHVGGGCVGQTQQFDNKDGGSFSRNSYLVRFHKDQGRKCAKGKQLSTSPCFRDVTCFLAAASNAAKLARCPRIAFAHVEDVDMP